MRFGLMCMFPVSALDNKEDSCNHGDELLMVHLRSRLSQTASPSLCKDVDDALWEPMCKNWHRVISEGVYAKSTQVCCSAIPVPCQLPGQDCSTGEDCVSPSCHQLESYLEFYESKVVDVFGSVGAARQCFFSTAKECGTKDAPMVVTLGGMQRGLIVTAVQEKTGDETKEVETVESEMHEAGLLQSNNSHSGGQGKSSASASLVDRASSGTREVVSANEMDTTLSEKDDVTTSENNIATSGVVGNEEFVNLIDQGPSVRPVN
eukprot:CAMPEP_0204318002 /NCGR_PEP_ID=MMETSP0469-20131031/6289_1 /ASSEMBLY_ACC=CAM_ASM_000384 /TAXON_ID=2969 /ORGANISM="Oxyrrhis marina" /LENGTH=262 /DNA_ID=CAMNT_0051298997 /DNA_START=76 /DNA_END=864 /DNA_ORIENTATION=-